MFYKNKLNSKISESPRATFTNQQRRACYRNPGKIIHLPQEFWTRCFFLVIYCMDFKAFLHNHLYYLIWKGSLLLSSRADCLCYWGIKTCRHAITFPSGGSPDIMGIMLRFCWPILELVPFKASISLCSIWSGLYKKSTCFTKVTFYPLVNTFPISFSF